MNARKKQQPLWKESLFLVPVAIAVRAAFNIVAFKEVVVNPFALIGALLIS